MATGIEDLANELLYAIFDYLDNQSLPSLSLVSRTLHRPALETVIIRLGGNSNMEKEALFHDSPSALLQAVRSALFIHSLQYVSVSINTKGHMAFLAELAQLFNRMAYVGYVRMHLSENIGPMEDDFMLKMVEHTLASLAGKNCKSLTLDGWDMPDSKCQSVLLEGGAISSSNLAKTSHLDNALPTINTLTQLHLQNWHILSTPIFRWIIDSANQSRITNCLISPSSDHTVSSTLPLLSLPYLTMLSILSTEIELEELLPFLGRHPTISYLVLLSSEVRATALDRSIPPPTFPNLKTLEISPNILPHILQIDVLPQILKSVTLRQNWPSTSESRIDEGPWYQAMDDALACLAERKGVQRLAFSFTSEGLIKAWLTSDRCNVESLMILVRTVSIGTYACNSFGIEMEPIFAKWLSLFPAVERVEVGYDMFATGWNGSAFASRLAKECPHLRTVKIGYSQIYDISDLDESPGVGTKAESFGLCDISTGR